MISETGRIVAIDADCLWVETIRRSTCGSCSVRGACGHGLLNRMSGDGRHQVRVLPGGQRLADYRIGDDVEISIPDGLLLRAAGIVYLLPLLGLFAGLLLLGQMSGSEAWAALGAATGFVMGLAGVRWHAWRHARDPALQPRLEGRCEPQAAAPVVFPAREA